MSALARYRRTCAGTLVAVLALATGCAPPPVLTPVRMADRGPAPLARTAEVRVSPSLYFEQERRSFEHDAAQLTFDGHDIAVRPNLFAAYAFTDSLTFVLPAGLLWTPVRQPECGRWLTLGGGVYGFAVGSSYLSMNDAVGVWGKQRFGGDFWLTGGLAVSHVYNSNERESDDGDDEDDERTAKNVVRLIPGVEAGVQLADAWSVTLLADYGHELLADVSNYSRIRSELVLVPVWWLDLGLHAGIYVHTREPLHVDPLIGFAATGRW